MLIKINVVHANFRKTVLFSFRAIATNVKNVPTLPALLYCRPTSKGHKCHCQCIHFLLMKTDFTKQIENVCMKEIAMVMNRVFCVLFCFLFFFNDTWSQ